MMRIFLGIVFLVVSFSCFTQNSRLNGTWILIAIRHDASFLASDSPYPDPYRWTVPNTHWLIKEDKIYEINYPCCLERLYHTSQKGKNLWIKTKGKPDEQFSMDFRSDSLVLTSDLPYGETYYLIKDTLTAEELGKYTGETINPLCLYGDWEIPTGEVAVRFDAINVYYPWKFPEKIFIDEKNLHHYWANNRLYLEVDSIKRPFRVKNISLQTGNMTLIPEKWVEEYLKKYNLSAYELETVWLRKPEEY